VLTIYTCENEAGDTPASYLKNNLRVGRSALDYERVTRSFFAISSTIEGLIFYSRCNFSRGDPLPRPGLSASRKARVGRRRDADQSIAAAARGLTVPPNGNSIAR
jgi:hypothetical protein